MRKLKLTELNRLSPQDYSKSEKAPIVLVLDNIRSGLNIGSAMRTADCLGIEAVYLCGISVCPPHREISKTAIGAEKVVEWKYFKSTQEALLELKQKSYALVGVEQTTNSVPLQDFEWKGEQPIALVMGNEVKGISEDALNKLDRCIEIPQFGTKHSFNVSVCTGIVLWDLRSRLI